MLQQVSAAVQDYLKAVYLEMDERDPAPSFVATNAIAARLDVSAASATNMLKKLHSLGLVEHTPYKGAALTETGRRVALEVVRHHRLIETYLAEALGVPWDEVHDEAEVLEHVLSERLEQRMAERLGHPDVDPHGHPIPTAELAVADSGDSRLWDAAVGSVVRVTSVSDAHPEALRYLGGIGIKPGSRLTVVDRGPVSGPLFVEVAPDRREALSKDVAESIWVA